MRKLLQGFIKPLDLPLLAGALCASVFGIALVISAVNNPPAGVSPDRLVLVQIAAAVLGLLLALVISLIDYHLFEPISKFCVPVAVLALVAVGLFAPEIAGNNSWLVVFGVSVQPSEFIKLVYIVTIAAHVSYLGDEINNPKNLFFLFLHAGAYIVGVLIQNDMGMATVYGLIFLIMIITAGFRIKYLVLCIVPVIGAIPFIWNFVLKDRQRFRILTLFNPELDPLGYGYQVIRSKIALGSGKFFGAGYMQGVMTQTNALPAKHTDFIFAVCGEEFGFFGCMTAVVLLLFIVSRIFYNTKKSTDSFGRAILVGVSAMFLVQIIINIGMCVGLTPVIGITLPFFSAGGSSMLSVWLAVGLVLSVMRHKKKNWQEAL